MYFFYRISETPKTVSKSLNWSLRVNAEYLYWYKVHKKKNKFVKQIYYKKEVIKMY